MTSSGTQRHRSVKAGAHPVYYYIHNIRFITILCYHDGPSDVHSGGWVTAAADIITAV